MHRKYTQEYENITPEVLQRLPQSSLRSGTAESGVYAIVETVVHMEFKDLPHDIIVGNRGSCSVERTNLPPYI